MAFWLLRGTLATLAVAATLIPAGAVALYGFEVLEAQQHDQDRRANAHQELMILNAEIELAEGKIALNPDNNVRNVHEASLDAARNFWIRAADEWRQSRYRDMADQIVTSRSQLSFIPAFANSQQNRSFDPNDFQNGESTVEPLNTDLATAGALGALVLWTAWGGVSQRPPRPRPPPSPVPVYPGEAEIPREPPEPKGQPIPIVDEGAAKEREKRTPDPGASLTTRKPTRRAKGKGDQVVRATATRKPRPTESHPSGRSDPPASDAPKEGAEAKPANGSEKAADTQDDNPAKLKE